MTPADISEIEARYARSIEAAREYARRAKKGLPADRWADGRKGEGMVADGIVALLWQVDFLAGALEAKLAEEARRGADAMEAHADPLR